MNACPYDQVSHFPGQSGAHNWVFFLKFEISFDRKDTFKAIRGVIYAVRGKSEHFDISKEGYETLKQQWMHIIMTQYCIIPADLANKMVLYFA